MKLAVNVHSLIGSIMCVSRLDWGGGVRWCGTSVGARGGQDWEKFVAVCVMCIVCVGWKKFVQACVHRI